MAGVIKEFIKVYNLEGIDYVSIHGHTIFHQPKSKITVQAANLPTVAAAL
jgi:anhydro-N-acetylmuramic acid kinase